MADFNLLLRNAPTVFDDRIQPMDIAIADGVIVALAPSVSGSADEEIDCTAIHVFPGVIDSHVHFNEPGREDWEGAANGSRAVAAGGGTCYFDMPLNSHPPVLDGATFDAKREALQKRSLVDFGIWGGITPLNLSFLDELAERGIVGFKAFMSNSGIREFLRADTKTLREGMSRAAKRGVLVAVHAEDEMMTSSLAAEAKGHKTARAYLDSRPPKSEWIAISTAIEIAADTGCALHIVHVSTPGGVDLVRDARAKGVNVTCETCPHYLTLEEADLIRFGAVAKCAPPLRVPATRSRLVRSALNNEVDMLGSDHSPAPPAMRQGDDFFAVWSGIASAQHLLPLMIDLWQRERSENWPLLARLLASNVAHRFGLPDGYNAIREGAQANLTLVDLDGSEKVTMDRLHYRHKLTPYAGRTLRGRIVRTLLRGQTVARDGQAVASSPMGRFVRPTRT